MVKKLVILGVLLLTPVSIPKAATWNVDPVHSLVGFTVKHLVITKVSGKFTDFSGQINYDAKDLASGSANFTVQAKSISTDNDKRDAHLKSPAFFAVDSFPTLTFTSKKVIPADSANFKLIGDLTIRGITKEVTFDCTYNGTISAMGGTRAAFSARTRINRQDYGVKWNQTLDGGGVVVSDDVDLDIEIEAVKAP